MTKSNKLINDIVRISVLEEEIEYYKTLPPAIKEKMRKADEESWQEVDTNTTK